VLVYSAVLAGGDSVFPAELAVEVGEVLIADNDGRFIGSAAVHRLVLARELRQDRIRQHRPGANRRGTKTRAEVLAPYPGSTAGQTGKDEAGGSVHSLVACSERHHSDQPRGPARLRWHPRDPVLDETAQRFQRLLECAMDHGSELVDAGRVEWFEGCAQSDVARADLGRRSG